MHQPNITFWIYLGLLNPLYQRCVWLQFPWHSFLEVGRRLGGILAVLLVSAYRRRACDQFSWSYQDHLVKLAAKPVKGINFGGWLWEVCDYVIGDGRINIVQKSLQQKTANTDAKLFKMKGWGLKRGWRWLEMVALHSIHSCTIISGLVGLGLNWGSSHPV